MALNQQWLDNLVKESLQALGINPVTRPEEAGYTPREFGMYLLRAVHDAGEGDVELDRDFLDQIEASLNSLGGPGSPEIPQELRWTNEYVTRGDNERATQRWLDHSYGQGE